MYFLYLQMKQVSLAVVDPYKQFSMYDLHSLQTLKCMKALQIKFVQGSVCFASLFPEKQPIHYHKLLKDPLFMNYKEMSMFLFKVLEELPPMIKNLVSGTFHYWHLVNREPVLDPFQSVIWTLLQIPKSPISCYTTRPREKHWCIGRNVQNSRKGKLTGEINSWK